MNLDKEYITDRVNPDQGTGCWEWCLSSNPTTGYGQIKEYPYTAHSLAYSLWNGIRDGEVIRHLCHNRLCCNPDHLVAGSYHDNWEDSKSKHLNAAKKRRGLWIIAGVKYETLRHAHKATGLHQGTICKYTRDGVFDIDEYRKGSLIARHQPKI